MTSHTHQCWPGLTGSFAYRNLVVWPIVNSDELDAAASALHNCAARHIDHYLFERVHLLTISKADGKILSMAELVIEDGGDGRRHLKVAEHRGPCNRAPKKGCVSALDAYLAAIDRGTLSIDHDALEAELAVRWRGFDICQESPISSLQRRFKMGYSRAVRLHQALVKAQK